MFYAKTTIQAAAGIFLLAGCSAVKNQLRQTRTSIENKYLEVRYDKNAGAFQFRSRQTGKIFVEKFECDAAGECVSAKTADDILGEGVALLVSAKSDDKIEVAVFPDFPFVVVSKILNGGKNKSRREKSVDLGTMALNINSIPPDELRANGTFGLLTPPAKEIGSYCYAAVASPATRSGVVAAYLTVGRGSGVVFVGRTNGATSIHSKIDYGALYIPPGSTTRSEKLAVGWFDDARIGLETYADAIAKRYDIHVKPPPVVYCSWYHLYRGVTEDKLTRNISSAAKLLVPYGLSVAQIDDGWQGGAISRGTPKKAFFETDTSKFPSGMKVMADDIKQKGLVPGIWYMPFSGDSDDPFFKNKQNLFARTADGKIFNAKWGGNPFDMTKPEARSYVEKLARTLSRNWGYKYLKIDGLWNGAATSQQYINTRYTDDSLGQTKLADSSKTHIQALRDGLKAVRKGAGEDVFILGCCIPQNMRSFSGAFGLVDAMRIGPDNKPGYPAILRGPVFGARYYFLHRRVWINDPDPLYVRNRLPVNEKRLLCSWVALTGQLNASSETYGRLSKEGLDILRKTMPTHALHPRPADFFDTPCPRIWLLTDDKSSPSRDVVGFFNYGNPRTPPKEAKDGKPKKKKWRCPGDIVAKPHSSTYSYDMEWIGLKPNTTYVGYEFWTNKFIGPVKNRLEMTVPDRDCRIIALRETTGHPVVVSTSRHITQGVVDILAESWDDGNALLKVTSAVVANDPYEFRVAAGNPGSPFKCLRASVSAKDRKAGASIKIISRNNWKLRGLITSPKSRHVEWILEFEKQEAR